MLACRLCLAFGEQDPEQWLENCPKRVLNIWRAFAIAEGWFIERHLAAVSALSLKRLVAMKYKESARQSVLWDIEKSANKFLPADMHWGDDDEQTQIDEGVLKVMSRSGGEVMKTPTYTTEIEADPWQQV